MYSKRDAWNCEQEAVVFMLRNAQSYSVASRSTVNVNIMLLSTLWRKPNRPWGKSEYIYGLLI